MSDAFLALFDGPMLTKFCSMGGSLGDLNLKAVNKDAPNVKLFTILQKKMRERKTKLTSGMVACICVCAGMNYIAERARVQNELHAGRKYSITQSKNDL